MFRSRLVLLSLLIAALGLAVTAQAPAVSPAPAASPTPAATPSASPEPAAQSRKAVPGHIFYVIPAYEVEYLKHVPPLTPHEKLSEMLQDTYDPDGLALGGVEALLEYSKTDGFGGYGKEWGGFAKAYGAAQLDANVSGFFGDYLFPVWLHQDPRYFRLGHGSVGSRIAYALSRVVVCRSDDTGKPVFDSSQLLGTVIAAAMSNLYYPKNERNFGHTMSRVGFDLGGTALFNLEAEFWRDIHRKLFH